MELNRFADEVQTRSDELAQEFDDAGLTMGEVLEANKDEIVEGMALLEVIAGEFHQHPLTTWIEDELDASVTDSFALFMAMLEKCYQHLDEEDEQ